MVFSGEDLGGARVSCMGGTSDEAPVGPGEEGEGVAEGEGAVGEGFEGAAAFSVENEFVVGDEECGEDDDEEDGHEVEVRGWGDGGGGHEDEEGETSGG